MSTQEEVYEQFLNYNWDEFSDFKEGLSQILDNYLQQMKENNPTEDVHSIPASDKQQLITQAKIFFFCSKTGNILNLDDYEVWRAQNGNLSSKPFTPVTEEKIQEISDGAQSEEPPYSSHYQELVELILAGKPVPGIKQIPDTVLTELASESKTSQRRKPWEKEDSSEKLSTGVSDEVVLEQ